MCNPFGQEAIRTHRLFRVLADRLGRNGVAVMRFEYFGTGDSAGEDTQANMTRWVSDMELAHQELRQHIGAVPIRWFGPRLGANVALQTLEKGQFAPDSMVLWDPIVDGKQYVQNLILEHEKRLKAVFRRPDFPWNDWQAQSCMPDLKEASGFPVSAELIEQLRAINLPASKLPAQQPCVVVCDLADPVTVDWISGEAKSEYLQVIDLRATFSWTEHEAQEGAIVPAKALQTLMRVLGD